MTEHPVDLFERKWRTDEARGARRSLAAYLSEAPGFEDEVARRWLELECEDRSRAAPRPDFEDGVLDPVLLLRYRIVRRIGSGGQGTVYLAEELGGLKRQVALKCLHGLDRPGVGDLRLRLKQGVQILSGLAHPFVCTIIEANLDIRVPYVVMRFVEGESLAAKIERQLAAEEVESALHLQFDTLNAQEMRSADEETAADAWGEEPDVAEARDNTPIPKDTKACLHVVVLMEQVARTLHWAHEQGVVHRDIKPGNIIVTPEGHGIIMDFDMARDDTPRSHALTRPGDAFGTPAYMAPELLRDQATEHDRRVDIWSLGVTLYQCLTLRRPFHGASRQGLFQAILTKEPVPLRICQPGAPSDLDLVIQKVLEKDPARRYQTAEELADDLARILRHEHPLARRPSILRRLGRLIARHPIAAAASTFAFLFSITTATLWSSLQAERAFRAQEAELKDRAEELRNLGEVVSPDLRWLRQLEDELAAIDSVDALERQRLTAALPRLDAFVADPKTQGLLGQVAKEHAAALMRRIRELLDQSPR